MFKRCLRCGDEKPRAEFPHGAGGRRSKRCSSCAELIAEERKSEKPRAYYNSPEYKALRRRRVGEAKGRYRPGTKGREPGPARDCDPDKLAEQNARQAWEWWITVKAPAWWLRAVRDARLSAKREQARRDSKRRYDANPVAGRHKAKIYKHANPDKVAKWGDRRKRIAAVLSDGTLTQEVVGSLFAKARGCPYCGAELTVGSKTLDHIVPLSRGGAHSAVNAVICCRDCNHRKSARPFDEWLGMLAEPHRARALRLYRQRYRAEPSQPPLTLPFGAAIAA